MLGEDTSVSDGLVMKLAPEKAINERVQRTGSEEACIGVQVNPSMTKSVVFVPGLMTLTQRVRLNRIRSQMSRNSVCLVLRVSIGSSGFNSLSGAQFCCVPLAIVRETGFGLCFLFASTEEPSHEFVSQSGLLESVERRNVLST